jgi:Fic family protein
MRPFDYSKPPEELMDFELMNLVSAIHEYKGKQDLYLKAKPDRLDALRMVAKVQSTGASNRIEGIHTSEKRLNELIVQKTDPENRSESEIAGYRDVLGLIHESHDHITPTTNVILQLHRDLYRYRPTGQAGRFKNMDNEITETGGDGKKAVRFKPLSAFETPDAMERLTAAFNEAIRAETYDPLLLVPMFILDFLCIHPFTDGNGRMSRLLTLLLLYRAGYLAGKYISLELKIEKTKESYDEALKESSEGWQEGRNSCLPFVRYFLEILLAAYKEFSERAELLQVNKISKSERIRILFNTTLQPVSKSDILKLYPGISQSMVEATLKQLLDAGTIIKLGAGKRTAYVRKTQ